MGDFVSGDLDGKPLPAGPWTFGTSRISPRPIRICKAADISLLVRPTQGALPLLGALLQAVAATRGTSRPASATADSSATQVIVASVTCTQTMSGGELELVLNAADQPLSGEQHATTVSGSSMRSPAPRHGHRNQTPTNRDPE